MTFGRSKGVLFISCFSQLFNSDHCQGSSLTTILPFQVRNNSVVLSTHLGSDPQIVSFLLSAKTSKVTVHHSLTSDVKLGIDRSRRTDIMNKQGAIRVSTSGMLHLSSDLSLGGRGVTVFREIHGNASNVVKLGLVEGCVARIGFSARAVSLCAFNSCVFREGKHVVPLEMPDLVVLPSTLGLAKSGDVSNGFVVSAKTGCCLVTFDQFIHRGELLLDKFGPRKDKTAIDLKRSAPIFCNRTHSLGINDMIDGGMPIALRTSANNSSSGRASMSKSVNVRFFDSFGFAVSLLEGMMRLSPHGGLGWNVLSMVTIRL